MRDALALQQEVGLPVVNDGEMRRRIWHGPVLDVADGFDPEGFARTWTARRRPDRRAHLAGGDVAPRRARAASSTSRRAFVLAHADRPVKVTLPVPTNFLSYWTQGVSDRPTPTRRRSSTTSSRS